MVDGGGEGKKRSNLPDWLFFSFLGKSVPSDGSSASPSCRHFSRRPISPLPPFYLLPSHLSPEPAHLHRDAAATALADHLARTQLRNCASGQMACRTVEGRWRWRGGNAISLCPAFTWPHSPRPPPACPSRAGGESCVCRLFPTITSNYGSAQCGPAERLSRQEPPPLPSSLCSGVWPGSM